MTNARSRLKDALLVGLSTLALLACTEVGLRALVPMLTWGGAHLTWEAGAHTVGTPSEWPPTYPKNSSGTLSYIEFSIPVRFNSDGFRDTEFQHDERNVILFLGDSSTEGHGVLHDSTFVSRVERQLRTRRPNITCWNAARSGTGTVEQVRILERLLSKYDHVTFSAVVLATCASLQNSSGNDLAETHSLITFLGGGRPSPRAPRHGVRDFVRSSAILHGAEVSIAEWRRRSIRMPSLSDSSRLWGDYYACLDRVRLLCCERQIPLLVACLDIYPSDRPHDIAAIGRRFSSYLTRYSIPFVMCAPQTSTLAQNLWFFPIDGHPNALGHRYIADQLIEPLATLTKSR
jgi:hypothetical protein